MKTENHPQSLPELSEGSWKERQTERPHLPLGGRTGSRDLEKTDIVIQ